MKFSKNPKLQVTPLGHTYISYHDSKPLQSMQNELKAKIPNFGPKIAITCSSWIFSKFHNDSQDPGVTSKYHTKYDNDAMNDI